MTPEDVLAKWHLLPDGDGSLYELQEALRASLALCDHYLDALVIADKIIAQIDFEGEPRRFTDLKDAYNEAMIFVKP